MIAGDNKQAFIDMLQQNTSIETLWLLGSVSGPVPFLAEALQNNTTLKTLKLSNCKLTSDMIKDVSRMLTVNSSLTSLEMCCTPTGDAGAAHLAEALKRNETLEKLGICGCGMTDTGVAPLAEALQVNNSLCELNLSLNEALSDIGAARLAEALKRNKTLEKLNISFCGITDAGVAPLAEALQVNNSLRELFIRVWSSESDLTENGKRKLREVAAEKSNFSVHL